MRAGRRLSILTLVVVAGDAIAEAVVDFVSFVAVTGS